MSRDKRLLTLLDRVRGRKVSLIQVHNNPDPDALGSAVGMQELYRRYLGIDSRIVFGGIVGRAENRTMLRKLQIKIVPVDKVDYDECDLLTLVDAQPGFGHTPLPEGRVPEVVIDHHPSKKKPDGVLYWDVGSDVGSTATMVGKFYIDNNIPIPRDVATALMYGIKSDTHDLSDEATAADIEVYQRLFSYGDTALLAQIENARVPRSYFAVFEKAIENAIVYDFACVSNLGRIDNPDMVAEMADFLLRCEDLRWTMVTGIYDKMLQISLRSNGKNAHAGAVARKTVGVMGTAGGHGRMAGGQVPLGDADKRTREEVVQAVNDLFLDAVKAKRTLAGSLVDISMLEETDTTEVNG